MTRPYENKQVVITGGVGGLGDAVVDAFVSAGAMVHIPNFLDGVPEGFSHASHPQVKITNGVDVAHESQVAAFYASVGEVWASIHLAGGFAMSPLTETSLDEFMVMFNRNAVTCFLSCREAVRAIRKSGDGGRIVNVGARPALSAVGGMIGYSTAKASVIAITQSLAVELQDDGIWVNAIAPSVIDTPTNRAAMPHADHGKWPKPAQLATVILFLASPENQVTTGSLVPVYGLA